MKNSINIFSETGCIQHEMLWKYRQGTLTAAEKHAVEVHLTDCELCSDALSGMMALDNDEVMAGLRESVRKISAPKKVIRFYDYRILSAAAAAAAIFVVFYVNNSPDEEYISQLTEPAQEQLKNAPPPYLPPPPAENKLGILQDREDVASEEESAESNIVAGNIGSDSTASLYSYTFTDADTVVVTLNGLSNFSTQTEGNYATATEPNFNTQPSFKAEPEETVAEKKDVYVLDETKVRDPNDMSGFFSNTAPAAAAERDQEDKPSLARHNKAETSKKAEPSKQRQFKTQSGEVMYIKDLKVSKTPAMTESEKLDTVDTGSIPAKYENEEQKAAETTIGRELPFIYSKTLRDGMNLFHNKQYNEASQTFSIILERLSNDVNSQFYKGLSEMEMQNYSQSAALLNKAMLNSDKTFYEEAKFKLALCYIELNRKNDAEKLLREIKEEKGFYSDKATKELQRLK